MGENKTVCGNHDGDTRGCSIGLVSIGKSPTVLAEAIQYSRVR